MAGVRWGIIGCGEVTEVKSGPALQKAERSSLVAVMRRTGRLAREYAERHGVPRWYDDARALVADPEVDAVYVATPPSSHREYALLAAGAGKPAYVEKPMALNHRECREMIDAFRAAKLPLFVAYYRRAQPKFQAIKQLIESGAIGDVRTVVTTLRQPISIDDQRREALPWRVDPAIAGGGRFVDLASHTLDFLDFALGPIREVRGVASNQAGLYRAEDVVSAAFLFESGVHAVGSWCFAAFDTVDRTEIVGSAGTISFSTVGDTPVVLTTSRGAITLPFEPPAHVQQPLIQLVVDELTGVGVSPSTGETAARTSWVMDHVLAGSSRADEAGLRV